MSPWYSLDTGSLNYDLNGDGNFAESESVPADLIYGMILGNHDSDGIQDVQVTFDCALVKDILKSLVNLDNTTLTITGWVADRNFVGSDTIKLLH